MPLELTEGAIESIVSGGQCDEPLIQIVGTKLISGGSGGSDRYRLLLSDGKHSYSHAMLATQLNTKMASGEMDNHCVVRVKQYICNTLQGDRRVMILLDVDVIAKGLEIGGRLGNPQPFKAGQASENIAPTNNQAPASKNIPNGVAKTNSAPVLSNSAKSPPPSKPGFNVRSGGTPGTPGSNRIHSIASLTPYQNRWRIRARVTQKSNIRTWSNSRGEGKLFSVNLLDESGEIRATGFTDTVDKYYNMLEVNKVYYISKATLKTANKQYTSVKNDYEMTFNSDSMIEPCEEQTDLPSLSFDFVKIDALESKQPQAVIDVIGVVKQVNDLANITTKAGKELSKRDIQLADQSGMVVNLTLWGNDAETFNGEDNPVIACKGCRLSDWGGRSLSLLSSSQMMLNPDLREAAMLKGWWSREGCNKEFQSYRSEGGAGAGGGSTNWKLLGQLKNENIGQDKADYFTSRGTVVFLRKENSMYQACPTESCNKKVVDQGNGMFRCEKCQAEYPKYKWRMILSVNLADHTGNQWVTCFQESAEIVLGIKADDLGNLKETNELAYDNVFEEASFKSYVFKLRAKVETYNDESRLKVGCTNASPIDYVEDGKRLLDEINKLMI
ncbi:replication protein A 70 kDa DNA-binding subunit-like [Mya arenaria]|uniref:replication protein A 70 kDa DNA-binding subunit-like n=1 Tax=Mya arenaria TaxID=6604 RepID=UPI0022E19463|nr:replication protein A 70 kDa DNA-binding subunit-like [Mya arenaria]